MDVSWGHLRARLPQLRQPPTTLAVCAIFKNEARYLAEWVAFHRLQGVERFWLYDNDSEDDWRSALGAFDGVEVTEWRGRGNQNLAYADCLRRHRGDADWIAFIDLDEFLFSPTGAPLPEILEAFEGVAGVAANWRTYGTSGHREPPSGLVIENYLWRVRDDNPVNRHVKSIMRPRLTATRVENPHYFNHYRPVVGEDGDRITSPFRDPPTAARLRVNHYYSRSEAELRAKLKVPMASDNKMRTPLLVPDEVCDDTILRWLPEVKAALT